MAKESSNAAKINSELELAAEEKLNREAQEVASPTATPAALGGELTSSNSRYYSSVGWDYDYYDSDYDNYTEQPEPAYPSEQDITNLNQLCTEVRDNIGRTLCLESKRVIGYAAGLTALAEAIRISTSLHKLDLSSKDIGSTAPPTEEETWSLSGTKEDRTHDTGFRALAEAFAVNTSIQELNLANNGLHHTDVIALAEALTRNPQPQLRVLDLSSNREIGHIGKGSIQSLARAIEENPRLKLETLNLADTDTGDSSSEVLAEALRTNTTLKSLNLGRNYDIRAIGATAIAKALESNTTLQTLNLSETRISSPSYSEILAALGRDIIRYPDDQEFIASLPHNVGTAALAEALKVNSHLLTLDLSGNKLGRAGLTILSQALAVNNSLRDLNLSSTGNTKSIFDTREPEPLEPMIFSGLKANTTLHTLNLSGNFIGSDGIAEIPAVLHTLDLSNNKIASALALAEALKGNTSLKVIHLEHNSITAEGAGRLINALAHNPFITAFNLAHNNVRRAEGALFSEALANNTSLKEIDLSHNNIKDDCAAVIAAGLATNTSIQKLILADNKIMAQGGIALAEALKTNSSLKVLDLKRNKVRFEGGKAFAEALKKNTSLETLGLTDNQIEARGGLCVS